MGMRVTWEEGGQEMGRMMMVRWAGVNNPNRLRGPVVKDPMGRKVADSPWITPFP